MNCGQIKMLFTLNNFQEAIETWIKVCKDDLMVLYVHGYICQSLRRLTLHTNIKHEQLYLFLLVFSFLLVIIHQMGNRVS